MNKVLCPHCGKPLANLEKLAWHLSRECPAMADVNAADAQQPAGGNVGKPASPRQ